MNIICSILKVIALQTKGYYRDKAVTLRFAAILSIITMALHLLFLHWVCMHNVVSSHRRFLISVLCGVDNLVNSYDCIMVAG